jgi:integrase
MKLNDETVAGLRLPEGKAEHFEWDEDLTGFGVRLRRRDGGRGPSRKWIVQFRTGKHQQRRSSIGDVGTVAAAKARKKAKEILAHVTLGDDPAAESKKRWLEKTMHSVLHDEKSADGKVLPGYLSWKATRMRPRAHLEIKRHLTKRWQPLHSRKLSEIERADVSRQHRKIAAENGPKEADNARSSLSGFFSWCMKEGYCLSNPVALTNKAKEESEPRSRTLADREIAEIWAACREDDYGKIVRLLILTAQRREEIGGLQRSEVDLEQRVLRLPGTRTKNGMLHTVPLSDAALDIIRAQMEVNPDRPNLFGERVGRPFSGWSRAKSALDSRIAAAHKDAASPGSAVEEMPHWTVHDFRRTALTGMARLGVRELVLGHVANHRTTTKAGITLGVYVQHDFAAEKRQALDLWADHVAAVVKGASSNVVTLPTRIAG